MPRMKGSRSGTEDDNARGCHIPGGQIQNWSLRLWIFSNSLQAHKTQPGPLPSCGLCAFTLKSLSCS